jgi:hypothetical protein
MRVFENRVRGNIFTLIAKYYQGDHIKADTTSKAFCTYRGGGGGGI